LLLLPLHNFGVSHGRLETEDTTSGQTWKTEENVCRICSAHTIIILLCCVQKQLKQN